MIEPQDYLYITTLLGEMDTLGVSAADLLDEIPAVAAAMPLPTSITTDIGRVIDSQTGITVVRVEDRHVTLSSPLRDMVVALNRQTVATDYLNLDAYLNFNNIEVTPAFAALSAKCGWAVSPDNVSS